MKKTRIIKPMRIVILAIVGIVSLPSFGQTSNESLINAIDARSITLNSDQLFKLGNIQNNKLHKSVNYVKIENLPNLAQKNKGAIPIVLPGSNRKYIARPTAVEFVSDFDYMWKGTFYGVMER